MVRFCGVPPHTPQGSAAPLTPCWRREHRFFKTTTLSLERSRTRLFLATASLLSQVHIQKPTQQVWPWRLNRPSETRMRSLLSQTAHPKPECALCFSRQLIRNQNALFAFPDSSSETKIRSSRFQTAHPKPKYALCFSRQLIRNQNTLFAFPDSSSETKIRSLLFQTAHPKPKYALRVSKQLIRNQNTLFAFPDSPSETSYVGCNNTSYGTQTLAAHTCVAPHFTKQIPQCFESFERSTHAPPQSTNPPVQFVVSGSPTSNSGAVSPASKGGVSSHAGSSGGVSERPPLLSPAPLTQKVSFQQNVPVGQMSGLRSQ